MLHFLLQEILNLPTLPNLIECFDISNHGTEFAVGSMSSFRGGIGQCGFVAGGDFHQHAHFGTVMDVGGNGAAATDFQSHVPRNLDVLADFGDDAHASRFQIRLGIVEQSLGDVVAEGLELSYRKV